MGRANGRGRGGRRKGERGKATRERERAEIAAETRRRRGEGGDGEGGGGVGEGIVTASIRAGASDDSPPGRRRGLGVGTAAATAVARARRSRARSGRGSALAWAALAVVALAARRRGATHDFGSGSETGAGASANCRQFPGTWAAVRRRAVLDSHRGNACPASLPNRARARFRDRHHRGSERMYGRRRSSRTCNRCRAHSAAGSQTFSAAARRVAVTPLAAQGRWLQSLRSLVIGRSASSAGLRGLVLLFTATASATQPASLHHRRDLGHQRLVPREYHGNDVILHWLVTNNATSTTACRITIPGPTGGTTRPVGRRTPTAARPR